MRLMDFGVFDFLVSFNLVGMTELIQVPELVLTKIREYIEMQRILKFMVEECYYGNNTIKYYTARSQRDIQIHLLHRNSSYLYEYINFHCDHDFTNIIYYKDMENEIPNMDDKFINKVFEWYNTPGNGHLAANRHPKNCNFYRIHKFTDIKWTPIPHYKQKENKE